MSKRTRIGKRYVTRTKDGQFKTNVGVGRSLSADRRRKAKNEVKAGRGHQGDIKRAEGGCGCGANSSMGGKTFAACGCGSKKKAETFEAECITCAELMGAIPKWSCECCGLMVGTEGDHEYCGENIDGTVVCNHCYQEGHEVTTMMTLDGNEVIFNSTCKGWDNEKHFGDREYEISDEYVLGAESFNAESFGAESRFDKLANKVAKDYESKGYSDKEAMEIGKKVAYSQGVKKYGKAGMTRLSKAGRKKAMQKSADSYSLNAESGQVNNMQATQSWQNSEPYATLEGYNPVDSVIASPPLGRGATQDFGSEQGYNDKMDESMGMRHRGKHSQSMKGRRDEASAMDKRHSRMGRKYDDVMTMDAEYDSPYGPRQTTDFGMVGMGNDFGQNAAETFSAEGGSEFMTGARYGAGAVIGITGATLILGTVMNLFMRK